MNYFIISINDFLFTIMTILQFITCSYFTAISYRLLSFKISNEYIKTVISAVIFILIVLSTIFIILKVFDNISPHSVYRSIVLTFINLLFCLLFIGLLIVEHYREIKFLKGKWESNSWNQSEKVILTFTGTSSIYGEIMLLDKNTQNILKEANLSCIKNSIFSPKNHKTFIVTMDNTVISIIRIELHEEYIELYYDCYKFGISIQSLINSFGEIEKKYYKKAK